MNKLKISGLVAFLLFGVNLVLAGGRTATVPRSQDGTTVETSDYAGVDYATGSVSRSTSGVLLFTGEGVVVGFVISSGSAIGDAVVFRATNSLAPGITNDNLLTNEAFRVNIATRSGSEEVGDGFTYKFPAPVRFKAGCVARIVGTAVHSIAYLFNSFGLD